GSWQSDSSSTHLPESSQSWLWHSTLEPHAAPSPLSSWHCDPSQYATPSLHSSLTVQGPLTGFSTHPPFLQTRPFPQPLTCAVATQLAPTSPVGAQVPAVAPALANVNPLHTSPSTQAFWIASALFAMQEAPVAIFFRQRPPSAE